MLRPILLLAILLAPTAHAGIFSGDPLEVRPGEPHSGSLLRFEVTDEQRAGDGFSTTVTTVVVLIEDPTRASGSPILDAFLVRDRFGVEHRADSYRIDTIRGGELVSAERCYALQGSSVAIRRDVLAGAAIAAGSRVGTAATSPLSDGRPMLFTAPRSSFESYPCFGRQHLHWAPYREGEVVELRDLLPEIAMFLRDDAPARSTPAEATEWNGWPALRYAFELGERVGHGSNRVEATVALGGMVRLVQERHLDGALDGRQTRELTGYAGGDGPIPPQVDPKHTLPIANPAATFVPYVPLRLDDAALELAYPYAEALAAVQDDPTSGWSEFARDGRLIQLVEAAYDRHLRDPAAPSVPTDGGWYLAFIDVDGNGYGVTSIRHAPTAGTPLTMLPRYVRNMPTVSSGVVFSPSAADVPTSASVAALAHAYGVAPGAIERLHYILYEVGPGSVAIGMLALSDVSAERAQQERVGTTLFVDLPTASTFGVDDTRATPGTPGLLDFPNEHNEIVPASGTSAFAALRVPAVGENIGAYAAGATGLAFLLLIALKFLAPLFTRLRRDRLLDNPVRARIFERIRAEPGMHRAEIVDFAGVGEGATRHHLAQLERHRLAFALAQDGFVRYFAAGDVPPALARREALLRGGSQREVYDLFASEPGLPLREAARRLGMSAPSVHRAKKRLEKARLLPAAREGEVAPG